MSGATVSLPAPLSSAGGLLQVGTGRFLGDAIAHIREMAARASGLEFSVATDDGIRLSETLEKGHGGNFLRETIALAPQSLPQ